MHTRDNSLHPLNRLQNCSSRDGQAGPGVGPQGPTERKGCIAAASRVHAPSMAPARPRPGCGPAAPARSALPPRTPQSAPPSTPSSSCPLPHAGETAPPAGTNGIMLDPRHPPLSPSCRGPVQEALGSGLTISCPQSCPHELLTPPPAQLSANSGNSGQGNQVGARAARR